MRARERLQITSVAPGSGAEVLRSGSTARTEPVAVELKPLLVGVRDAAALLGIGYNGVYDLLNSGDLASVRIGARRLIPYAALVSFVERLQAEQA